MDLLQTTTVLMLCLTVRGDYSAPSTSYGVPTPSTSYGAPSYDSHSENHSPVKRHVGCSRGGWYNGGSGSVQPGHSSSTPCSQNSPAPLPASPCGQNCGEPQKAYTPQQTQHYPQPQSSPTHPFPSYSHAQPQQPSPRPQNTCSSCNQQQQLALQPQSYPQLQNPSYSQSPPQTSCGQSCTQNSQPPPSYPQPQNPPYFPPSYPQSPPISHSQPPLPLPPPSHNQATMVYSLPVSTNLPPPVMTYPNQPLSHPQQQPIYSGSPSPRITQPPPYPLPTGPTQGSVASGSRPDYLPHYPATNGGYGLSSRPYNFGYSVRDFHTGADFKQQETSDGNTVKGQYRVQLPDGRTQIVTYTADWQTGFHADVQYEGEASYPAVYGTGGSYPPSSVSTSYGVPSQPSSSYGVPSQPSSSYGVPSHSSTSYSSPQASTGYSPSTHGSSYQSRVGVGGVGNQYQNIGYPSSGTSHGHAGY